eukprot:TRINITY_DN32605_c0_g1_i1.p1 TRINITY_DN32605_c0_g1~~TRINITY_DN32605_c0_g1_i1.p1  ORF type:complete len:479 (-),score=64.15 TRINITY_DN32605_c0_g1_i1:22-1425(-)
MPVTFPRQAITSLFGFGRRIHRHVQRCPRAASWSHVKYISSMAHGRFATAAPGPTTVPENVLNAMHADTTNYVSVLQSGKKMCDGLRKLARTKHHVKVAAGNGHVGWQMALANVFEAGDVVVVLDSQGFAYLWGLVAESMGIVVKTLRPRSLHERIDPAALEQCLKDDKEGEIKAVLALHTDSDFTVHNDICLLRAAIDAAHHPALFLVDCVATFGCVQFEMDLWGVDVLVAACQKGLMLPPGLAILCISEKALEARRRKKLVPMVSDWLCGMTSVPQLIGYNMPSPDEEVPWIAIGTPPTQLLLGLMAALDTILNHNGLEETWKRHEIFAQAVWAAIDTWGRDAPIRCFVPDVVHRSPVVTLVKAEGIDALELRRWCQQEANLLLPGAGLGFLMPPGAPSFQPNFKGNDAFRIAHMGYQNPPMLLGTLATIDCAFKALRIPHGNGAVCAASQVLAASWAELNHERV